MRRITSCRPLPEILSHTLNVVEDSAPLGMRAGRVAAVPVQGDREFDSRVTRIVVDDVKLSLGRGVRKAPLEGVEQVLVKELKFNRYGYSLAHNSTMLRTNLSI